MTALFFAAVAVGVLAMGAAVVVAADLVAGRGEARRRRAEFDRWNRLLGPTMKQWEEELRAEGLEVPPPAPRRD